MTTCSHCGTKSESPFLYCPSCGTRANADQDQPLEGRILAGKYRVVEEIGRGSMGTVYLAEHTALRKKIALKLLHRDLQVGDEARRRFQREGIAAGQINHPNVIQIFDFDRTDDGLSFLAMEYVDGENLKVWLQRSAPLPPELAVAMARQLLATLGEAHRHGIVHRDLKPENLMVVPGSDQTAPALKVLDFGLSKLVDRPVDASMLTMSGHVVGTPLYMAPEQWHGGETDHRADLYAAALILYEMLTGRQPFQGSSLTETLLKSATEPPPSLLETPGIQPMPRGLDAVLRRALAKDPDERYPTAPALIEALDEIDPEHLEGPGRRTGRKRRAAARPGSRPRRRGSTRTWQRPVLAGAALVAVVLAALPLVAGSDDDATRLVRDKPAAARTSDETGYLSLLDDVDDHLRIGDLELAAAVAEKAVRHEAADAEAFAVRAAVHRRRGHDDDALADYRTALERFAGYGPAHAGIGWILLEQGELDDAAATFDAAVEADAECADGFAGRGAVHLAGGDPTAALAVLDPAADRFPAAPAVHYQRGRAQQALGDVDGAVTSFTRARRGDPGLWQAAAALGRLYVQKDNPAAAEQQLEAALQDAPEVPALRLDLAAVLLAQERFEDARRTLAPIVAQSSDGEVHALAGLAEHGRGDGAAAATSWERALELGVGRPSRLHLLLCAHHLEQQRWQQALEHGQAALEAPSELDDGERARAAFDCGLAHLRLGSPEQAATQFEQAVAHGPPDPVVHRALGVLYMDYLERPEDAAEQFRAYRQAGGDDARVDGWLRTLTR